VGIFFQDERGRICVILNYESGFRSVEYILFYVHVGDRAFRGIGGQAMFIELLLIIAASAAIGAIVAMSMNA
jgi:hypothetical protein